MRNQLPAPLREFSGNLPLQGVVAAAFADNLAAPGELDVFGRDTAGATEPLATAVQEFGRTRPFITPGPEQMARWNQWCWLSGWEVI